MEFKKLILIFPVIFLIIYFGADVFYEAKYVCFIKPLIIPSFMIYAIVSNFKRLTINFYLFALFFYIGEIMVLFWFDYVPLMRYALISYFLCYLSLVYCVTRYFEKIKVIEIFKGYTLFVFILNIIFFSSILYIIVDVINDFITNIIVSFNTISAIILLICSVLYLSFDGTKKSYLFFFGTIAKIMNDVFSALEAYYLESSTLNILDRILHFAAFGLFYMFFVIENQNQEFHKNIAIAEN